MKSNSRLIPQDQPRAACVHKTLARSGTCSVDMCSCGALHISVGPFSIRLTEDAFEDLVATMCRAREAHGAASASSPVWRAQTSPGEPS